MASEAESVMIAGCQLLGSLLSVINSSCGNEILDVFSSIDNIQDLPKIFFGRKFFGSEPLMESVNLVFESLLNHLNDQRNNPRYASLFKNILLNTIEMVNSNFKLGVETEPKKWASFAVLLKVLVRMATVTDDVGNGISGHLLVFRKMTVWLGAFFQNFDSYLSVKQGNPEVPGPLLPMEVMLQYMLDIGRSLQPGRDGVEFEREGTPTTLSLSDLEEIEGGAEGYEDEEEESGDDSVIYLVFFFNLL